MKSIEELTTIQEQKTETNDLVLKELLSDEKINLKTDLNDKEILTLTKLEIIGRTIRSETLLNFLQTFKTLRVSKLRKGRTEIIQGLERNEEKKKGLFGNFMNDLVGQK